MSTRAMEAMTQGSPAASPPLLMPADIPPEDTERAAMDGAPDGAGWLAPLALEARGAPSHRLRHKESVLLANTIAEEVVPRLVLAHRCRSEAHAGAGSPPDAALAESVPTLARLAAASDVVAAEALVGELHARGHSLEAIYLDLICPAARHLDRLWHEDAITFADVTIGVLALQRLLHALDHAFCFCADAVHRDPARRALLSSMPGEPHSLAVDVIGAFLRRAGWEVVTLTPREETELCLALHDGWFAVLGLSDSCGLEPEVIAGVIHRARRASQNRRLRVMVGGPAFCADPELAIRVGADATATDARHAVTQADCLFALLRRDG